jgi:hypothetical protein
MALTTNALVKEALQSGTLYTDQQIDPSRRAAIDLIHFVVTAEAFAAEPHALQVAALGLSVDIFQSQVSPGGQMVDPTMSPSPFRLGRSLLSRYQALLAPYTDVEGLIA